MLIFDIKKFALHDGPGIRTTVFFKGCPLHCEWCHNPESQSPYPQKMYDSKKCIGCCSCVTSCRSKALTHLPDGIVTDFDKCDLCGECVEACPSKAMTMCGRLYSYDEVMSSVLKDRAFYDTSSGGVTFSGGEPLLQHEALFELLAGCRKERLHSCIDTSLFADSKTVEKVASLSDLLLVDIKQMDSDIHLQYTGVRNELILENIKMISKMGVHFWIRIPLIGGVNDDNNNITATADFLRSLPVKPERVDLLPYHSIGNHKYHKLGAVAPVNVFSIPSQKKVDEFQVILNQALS